MLSSSSSSDSDDDYIALRKPKVIRPRVNHFDKWNDSDFYTRFRLTKPTFLYLLQQIENSITLQNKGGCVSPMNQVLLTLRFYATGSMLISAGDFINVPKATACRIIQRVSNAIASLRPEYIRMPETVEEMNSIVEDFFTIARFPKVMGTIDCTHIRIQSPGQDDAEIYRNRKGFFSINVQSVADAKLKFQNIVARWPGSVHDQTIFNNSLLKTQLENNNFGDKILLGDSGYALKPFLMTPLLQTNSEAENLYNESLIRTRNTVERQYGVWKRRFPVLSFGMRLELEKIKSVIIATAVLHNIAIDMNDPEPDVEDELDQMEPEEHIIRQNIPQVSAVARRQQFINEYFATL